MLVVDKPEGITSHDVVARVRRILSTRRVGHVGTLDPMATGVLPLVLERATRLAPFLSAGDKVYHAVIRLGVTTDTYDATGTVTKVCTRAPEVTPDRTAIDAALEPFTGTFLQTPPPFSAKKIGGVRAYRLARRKTPVKPSPVEVTVRSVEVEAVEDDRLTCRVTCAPGFYMRSLAHDLGETLGVGGCLERLRRERSGAFSLSNAVSLHQLELHPETAASYVLPVNQLLPELPRVVVTERGARLAAHGNMLTPTDLQADAGSQTATGSAGAAAGGAPSLPDNPAPVRIFDRQGALLAIAEQRAPGILQPRIVLV